MTATSAFVKKYTLEEYFELEYESSDKHEYLDGKIKTITYTNKSQGRIAANLSIMLGDFLENTGLEIYNRNRILYVTDCNKVYYPDLMVLPQDVETFAYRGKMEADLYPIALIEILSDSTEDYDYQEKWHCYQKISTLQEYMLVSQKFPFVEVFRRQSGGEDWLYSAADKEESIVTFAGCSMTLKNIYKRVKFPPEAASNDEKN